MKQPKTKAVELIKKLRFKKSYRISNESDFYNVNESDCYKVIDIALKEKDKEHKKQIEEIFKEIIEERIVCNDNSCEAPCCKSFRKLKKSHKIII